MCLAFLPLFTRLSRTIILMYEKFIFGKYKKKNLQPHFCVCVEIGFSLSGGNMVK